MNAMRIGLGRVSVMTQDGCGGRATPFYYERSQPKQTLAGRKKDSLSLSSITVQTVAFLVVLGAAGYLLLLGVGAFARPARTAAFLGGFAQTLPAHLLELALRIGIGTALVVRASSMHFGAAFAGFGWILIASSVALVVIPWRLHQRFARWSVPQATRRMPLLGIGSTLAGLVVLAALVLPRAAS